MRKDVQNLELKGTNPSKTIIKTFETAERITVKSKYSKKDIENIEHLEDNSEENKLESLYEINIKLKEELDKNQKIRDTNAGKLRKLTEEMEEIKRKKKGWC